MILSSYFEVLRLHFLYINKTKHILKSCIIGTEEVKPKNFKILTFYPSLAMSYRQNDTRVL